MCALCRIMGRNVFAAEDEDHDVNDDTEIVVIAGTQIWYIWRRSDGCVGATNAPPHAIFNDDYRYYTLGVVVDPAEAQALVMIALSCN